VCLVATIYHEQDLFFNNQYHIYLLKQIVYGRDTRHKK
jgi:hypothetical protein